MTTTHAKPVCSTDDTLKHLASPQATYNPKLAREVVVDGVFIRSTATSKPELLTGTGVFDREGHCKDFFQQVTALVSTAGCDKFWAQAAGAWAVAETHQGHISLCHVQAIIAQEWPLYFTGKSHCISQGKAIVFNTEKPLYFTGKSHCISHRKAIVFYREKLLYFIEKPLYFTGRSCCIS